VATQTIEQRQASQRLIPSRWTDDGHDMKFTACGDREKQQWLGYRGATRGGLCEVPVAHLDDLINCLDAALSQRLAEIEASLSGWKEESARPRPLRDSSREGQGK
jgi:hypothetical protein